MARTAITLGRTHGLIREPLASQLEKNSSTFKRGAILINTSGTLDEAAANPTTGIIGVANQDGQNGTSKTCLYIPNEDSIEFEISVDKASDLAGTNSKLAQTDMFGDFGITKDSSGVWYLDVDKSAANQVVFVTGFKDPAGTVQGRVYVKFKRATAFNA